MKSEVRLLSSMNVYLECDDWKWKAAAPVIMTQFTQAVVAQACRQKYRVTNCSGCGGPRIHSKVSGRSKCFRCGAFEESKTAMAAKTRMKCQRCLKFRWAVLKANYCDDCLPKVQKARREEKGQPA